jgi:hypothetical protein
MPLYCLNSFPGHSMGEAPTATNCYRDVFAQPCTHHYNLYLRSKEGISNLAVRVIPI